MNNFDKKLAIGKKGETVVADYLRSRNHEVIDVSDSLEYRHKDIDFLLINQEENQKCSLEVKSDRRIHQTGNFCIEESNDRKYEGLRDGWLHYCEADYVCFYDYESGEGYIVDWLAAKQLITKCELKRFWSSDGCYSYAYLMPIGLAKKKNLIAHTFNLEVA